MIFIGQLSSETESILTADEEEDKFADFIKRSTLPIQATKMFLKGSPNHFNEYLVDLTLIASSSELTSWSGRIHFGSGRHYLSYSVAYAVLL